LIKTILILIKTNKAINKIIISAFFYDKK